MVQVRGVGGWLVYRRSKDWESPSGATKSASALRNAARNSTALRAAE